MRNGLKIQNGELGQTLVEAIVAIAVILTGIISAVTLTVATVSAGRGSDFSIVAYNLAREGIEVVRSRRDSTWLERERGGQNSWDEGLFGTGNDHSAIISFNPVSNDWSLDFGPDTFEACMADKSCLLYRDANNVYTTESTGSATPFYRLVFLYPICLNGDIVTTEGSDCGGLNPKVGLQLVSEVRFYQNGRVEKNTLIERIYNWRVGG